MSIVGLQRRLREAGRLRIGDRDPNKGYPRKLRAFRFTSPDRNIIDAVAEQYGGTPHAWTDDQWEVLTKADRLDVVVPPSAMSHSVYYELWTGGGCVRRCDGVTELIHDTPCVCDPDPATRECKPHTRLSVILPDLPTVGVWRIDTTGYYAATELLGVVELLDALAASGRYAPAELRLEWRTVKRAGEATRQFAVPVLDPKIPMRELAQWAGKGDAGAGALGGNGIGEVPAPSFTPVPAALPQAPTPSITEQLQPRERTPRKNAVVPIPSTGLEPGTDAGAPGTATSPPASTPEEGGDEPPLAPPSDGGPTLPPDQFLAMEIAEALGDHSDDARHSFLAEYSHGRYFSAKDVPIHEIAALRAELVRRKQERTARGDADLFIVEKVVTPPEGDELFPDSDLEQKSAGELRTLAEQRRLIEPGTTPRTHPKAKLLEILRGP